MTKRKYRCINNIDYWSMNIGQGHCGQTINYVTRILKGEGPFLVRAGPSYLLDTILHLQIVKFQQQFRTYICIKYGAAVIF